MKIKMKKLLIAAALLLTAGFASAQNELKVADFTLPQSGGTMVINLNLAQPDVYTSYQFNIVTPEGIGYVTDDEGDVDCQLGEGYHRTHSATVHWNENGRKLAVGVISTSSAYFTSQNLKLEIPMATTTLAVGSEVEFTITGIDYIQQTDAKKDHLADVTFKVIIGEPADTRTILDETSTTPPENAEGVDVRVKRTIAADQWSTIVLPFAMTEAQCKEVFGSDVKLGDFTGVESDVDEDENVVSIKVSFAEATAIEANHPYIIKVSAPVTEFTVDGVDIEPEDELSVDKDEYKTGSGTKKDPYVYHYNSFVGTYVADTEVPDLCLFLNGNEFWYSKGLTKMKGYRAYFDFYDVLTSVEDASSRMAIVFSDEATGISQTATAANADGRYYNLQGQLVEAPQKGIYVVNGKKVIVK